jgi:excisionase family DNA binding protein
MPESEHTPEKLLNVRATAEVLGVSESTIRNWQRRGLLKAVRLPDSGFRRFSREDIERMRQEMWSQYAPQTGMPGGKQ